MATTPPRAIKAAASSMTSVGSPAGRPSPPRNASAGPHAGHATGSAWKRRSAGSSYSRRQSSHMGNAHIDVRSRS